VAKVVRQFAFLPPAPPLYKIQTHAHQSTHENLIEINHPELFEHEPTMEAIKHCQVHSMTTRLGERVYGFSFSNPDAKFTILYVHGNAMDCAALLGFWRQLSYEVCANIFALEYSGYGASSGEASVDNTIADIEAAYDYLLEEMGILPENIVLYGQSVGSGPVCNLASRRPARGVVLHCALTTGLQTIFGAPTCCSPSCTFSLCDIYKNINMVEHIDAPVFVIHGTDDEVIHVSHGKDLYRKSKHTHDPYWVHGAKHNDVVEVDPTEYFRRINGFLHSLETRSTRGGLTMSVRNETELNPTSEPNAPGV